jgi:hypothetical protein
MNSACNISVPCHSAITPPNREWDHNRQLDFFDKILIALQNPVARCRWFPKLAKWRLAKPVNTRSEKGFPT